MTFHPFIKADHVADEGPDPADSNADQVLHVSIHFVKFFVGQQVQHIHPSRLTHKPYVSAPRAFELAGKIIPAVLDPSLLFTELWHELCPASFSASRPSAQRNRVAQ